MAATNAAHPAMTQETARQLRASGHHEQARTLLVGLAAQSPNDAVLQYETACVHDFLGLERQAVPYYLAALAGELPASARRGAYVGLGSTYRSLGLFAEARQVLETGSEEFCEANELRVFLAMTEHNLGNSKQAVQTLLRLLATTTIDADIRAYARAIEFYAEDIDRTWPNGAS